MSSSPEALMNKLHRGNFSESLLQEILTSFQAVPKLVDEDIDNILIIDAPEIRERVQTNLINPGQLLTKNRDRADGLTYIREIPTTVNVYPLEHSFNGNGNIVTTGRIFEGGWETDGTYYQNISDATRLNPTTDIGIIGWLYVPTGITSGKIVYKNTQYDLNISAANTLSFHINSNTPVTASFTNDIWFHFAATYNTSNGQKIYINNVEIDNDATSGSITTSSNDVGIFGTDSGTVLLGNGSRLAWLSILAGDLSTSWIDNHFNGILDTNAETEITTIPFVAHDRPKPDCSVGLCQVN